MEGDVVVVMDGRSKRAKADFKFNGQGARKRKRRRMFPFVVSSLLEFILVDKLPHPTPAD